MLKYFYTCFILLSSFQFLISQVNDRATAVNDYYDTYLDTKFKNTTLSWTGDIDNCIPGDIPIDIKNKIIGRINYYRRMVGVEDQASFSPALNLKTQQAALILDANNALAHFPPNNWKCLTPDGTEALKSSNIIQLDDYDYNAVDEYMFDRGDGNESVGHRRWLLYSKAQTFGIGQTPGANAIWVLGNRNNPSVYNNFIAYPPAGYFPNNLVPDRWSFSIPNADFTNASVTVKLGNTDINLDVVSSDGFDDLVPGDNTIVWEPTGLNNTSTEDIFYTVDIDNVIISGSSQNFSYTTKFFNPFIKGDANVDGRLSISDALYIANYIVGNRFPAIDCNYVNPVSEICLQNADTSGDGNITIADALFVAQCIVGLHNTLCPN